MGQRRRARECALQMLFQIDLTGVPPEEVFATFWAGQEAGGDVRRFAARLVLGVHAHRLRLDAALAGSAVNWRVERMAVVDRNVLRMAAYELTPPILKGVGDLGPPMFWNASAPTPAMVVWSVGLIVVMLAVSVRAFNRRAL